MNEAYWLQELQKVGAIVTYPGEPRPEQPHCLAAPGRHSGGVVRSTLLTENPQLLQVACAYLAMKLGQSNWEQIRRVYGPALGAIPFAYQLAANMGKLFGFVEREEGQEMFAKRFSIIAGEVVLMCEDKIYTGGSLERSVRALHEVGAFPSPYVLALFNLSGRQCIGDLEIISLVTINLPTWTPIDCPYCKVGSKAIQPRGAKNWVLLRGEVA